MYRVLSPVTIRSAEWTAQRLVSALQLLLERVRVVRRRNRNALHHQVWLMEVVQGLMNPAPQTMIRKLTWQQMLSTKEGVHPNCSYSTEKKVAQIDVSQCHLLYSSWADLTASQ